MKKIVEIFWILFILFISVTNISAQTKPTPEAAKAFLNFYFKGQGQGVVLADVKEVETESFGEGTNRYLIVKSKASEKEKKISVY